MWCMCVFLKSDLRLYYLVKYWIISCSNTWSRCVCNYCVWHPNCVRAVCLKGTSLQSRAAPEARRNDFQHRECVTWLQSWMWSLPYGTGTRAFKGNCIPLLLVLCWSPPHTHTHTRELAAKFIFDWEQKFSQCSGLNESISPHKPICFSKVNVSQKQMFRVLKIVGSHTDDW